LANGSEAPLSLKLHKKLLFEKKRLAVFIIARYSGNYRFSIIEEDI